MPASWREGLIVEETTEKIIYLPFIPQGRILRHYKGGYYLTMGMWRHSETEEPLCLLKPLGNTKNDGWYEGFDGSARPAKYLFDDVEKSGYKGPRFILLNAGKASDTCYQAVSVNQFAWRVEKDTLDGRRFITEGMTKPDAAAIAAVLNASLIESPPALDWMHRLEAPSCSAALINYLETLNR